MQGNGGVRFVWGNRQGCAVCKGALEVVCNLSEVMSHETDELDVSTTLDLLYHSV